MAWTRWTGSLGGSTRRSWVDSPLNRNRTQVTAHDLRTRANRPQKVPTPPRNAWVRTKASDERAMMCAHGGISDGLGHRGESAVRRVDHHQRWGGDPRRALAVHRHDVQPVRRARAARSDEGLPVGQPGEGLLAAGGQLLRHHRRPAHAQRRVLRCGDELPRSRHRHRDGRSVLPGQRRRVALHRARPCRSGGAGDGCRDRAA